MGGSPPPARSLSDSRVLSFSEQKRRQREAEERRRVEEERRRREKVTVRHFADSALLSRVQRHSALVPVSLGTSRGRTSTPSRRRGTTGAVSCLRVVSPSLRMLQRRFCCYIDIRRHRPKVTHRRSSPSSIFRAQVNASEVTEFLKSLDLTTYAETFYDEDFRRTSDLAALQESTLEDRHREGRPEDAHTRCDQEP